MRPSVILKTVSLLIGLCLACWLGYQLGSLSQKALETPLEVSKSTPIQVEHPLLEPLYTPIEESMADANERLRLQVEELETKVKKLKRDLRKSKTEVQIVKENVFVPSYSCIQPEPSIVANSKDSENHRHRIYGIFGYGVKGARIQSDGNQVWVEPTRGFVGGFGYQYQLTPRFNIGGGTVGAETIFGTIGADF